MIFPLRFVLRCRHYARNSGGGGRAGARCVTFLQSCCTIATAVTSISGRRAEAPWRHVGNWGATVGEETVGDDLGLLLDAVARNGFPGFSS